MEVVEGENPLSDNLSGTKAVTQESLGKTGDVRVGVLAER